MNEVEYSVLNLNRVIGVLASALLLFTACQHGPLHSDTRSTAAPSSVSINENRWYPASAARILPIPRSSPECRLSKNVPETLYHFGSESDLINDVQNQGMLPSVWNRSIRGEKMDWKLPAFRRGLWGAASPSEAEGFADRNSPWLVWFDVKKECRTSPRNISMKNLANDPRMGEWIKHEGSKVFNSLGAFKKTCVTKNESGNTDLNAPYFINDLRAVPKKPECEMAINKFLDDERIQIIQDEGASGGWIIRDPECVGKIMGGSSADVLDVMAMDPTSWQTPCGGRDGIAWMRILARALTLDAGTIPFQRLKRIEKNILGSGLESPPVAAWSTEMMSAYWDCRQQSDIPRFGLKSDQFGRTIANGGASNVVTPFPNSCR